MEEDRHDLAYQLGHSMARNVPVMSSFDGTNFSTVHSDIVSDIFATMEIKEEQELLRWYIETIHWVALKCAEEDAKEISLPFTRNDKLTSLSCYAAYMSMKQAMDALYLDMTHPYCGVESIIKRIHDLVLPYFDTICKNSLIENSCEADGLRDKIIKAAELAKNYYNSQAGILNLQGNDESDAFIWEMLQTCLIGRSEDVFSKMHSSTEVVHDDDIVGLSSDLMKIKERLLRYDSKLGIMAIVGMGGIGKTTLARRVCMDPEILPLFHIHIWIVVSREFNERDVLLRLLESIAPLPDEVYKEDTEQLAAILYRRLKGWRYFIVLDDIWTIKAWNDIKLCFPDDNNGSRIILTSRIAEVASYVDRDNPPHIMNFLGVEDSWELLRKKVYGKAACPPQLINIGMQIAEKCQGLPLAIEVMAGYLSNKSKTEECWEEVAKTVGFPTEETQMESFSDILSLSYNDLPEHLKACFLTMVNFPKNSEISVRKLARLWSAMGFLPQKMPHSVEMLTTEEVALNCLENLIGRSLIMVRKKKYDGKAKICGIHDLLWDLSMREFLKEGHYIFGTKSLCNSDYMNACDDDKKYVIGICQTLLYFDKTFESDYLVNSQGFGQLRVLDILNQSFNQFPIEITGLFNLRYLALATPGNIPDSICKLSNLETLLNYHEGAAQMLSKEIWSLAHLRHLQVRSGTSLSNPPSVTSKGTCKALLPSLQSLSYLSCSSCTEEVLQNTPNLKQLSIYESEEEDTEEDELLCCALENLLNLHQLESLKLFCNANLERQRRIPDRGSFLPNTIKKLTLCRSNLPWSEMNALAMLPSLEVLKLMDDAFIGDEWKMEDEEFTELKYLLLDSLDLIFWEACSENFPKLQQLCIWKCQLLCRIPKGFAEISTLKLIDLDICYAMLYDTALEIQREQIAMGNDELILQAGGPIPVVQSSIQRILIGFVKSQIMGFVASFVWMAMKFNILKTERDD